MASPTAFLTLLACGGGTLDVTTPAGTTTPVTTGSTTSTSTTGTSTGTTSTSTSTSTTTGTTTTGTDPVAVTSLTGAPNPAVVQEYVFTVVLEDDAGAFAACTLASDPAEVILAESGAPATSHELRVQGLLPGGAYDCVVAATAPGSAPELASFTVGGLTSDVPDFNLTVDEPTRSWGAWTLFNDTDPCNDRSASWAIIVDRQGVPRWQHKNTEELQADLDTWWMGEGRVHMGGGWGLFDTGQADPGIFKTVSLSGEVLIDRAEPDFGYGFNHHSQPLADGTYLSLTTSRNEKDGTDWWGIAVEVWDPSTGTVVWTWDSQQIVDLGQIGVPSSDNPWVANSVSFFDDADGPGMFLSLYSGQEIWRVDRTTGELSWRMAYDSDFTLQDEAGNTLDSSEWMYGQHDPEWSLQGGDLHVLMHDNGVGRPGGSYSRAVEYRVDPAALTVTRLWEWAEDDWYNPVVGDADRLANGNVLITEGFAWCLTFDPSGRSAVLEVDPASGDVVWRMDWDSWFGIAFRANRHDGCEIFQNAAVCPEVADRVSQLLANLGE